MFIIYKRNFVDLVLIVAFSTVIIIEYWNILQQQDDLKLPVNTSDSSMLWKYCKVELCKTNRYCYFQFVNILVLQKEFIMSKQFDA